MVIRVKSKIKRHELRLINLEVIIISNQKLWHKNKHIIHNFSLGDLASTGIKVLSFELEQHILCKVYRKSVYTAFHLVTQNLLQDSWNLPEQTLLRKKTKLHYTCKKHCQHLNTLEMKKSNFKSDKHESIVMLKRDKGRGFVILNCSTLEKVFHFQFESVHSTWLGSYHQIRKKTTTTHEKLSKEFIMWFAFW